jgi:hypothetical protein
MHYVNFMQRMGAQDILWQSIDHQDPLSIIASLNPITREKKLKALLTL